MRVGSTAELRAALLRLTQGPAPTAGFDALVMAAAVADFRPVAAAETKLPRTDDLTLRLESTPDLLAEVARIAHGLDSDGAATREPLQPVPVLVGFAAETGSLERAADKLRRKGVDLLVANDVAEPGSGFGTDTNRVSILAADGSGRTCRSRASAPSRTPCSTGSPSRWTSATPPRRLAHHRSPAGDGMSATSETIRRLTVVDIAKLYADGQRIPMLTAYDFPTAQLLDEAGIPLLLVGDSLGQVMLGYETTVRVTMTGDAPPHQGRRPRHAARPRRRATCRSCPTRRPRTRSTTPGPSCARPAPRRSRSRVASAAPGSIETLVRAGIPVMGHIGLTPQAINAIGKVRVQGKTRDQARSLLADALAVQEAGAFAIVLELVPEQLAAAITERLRIPTIGIGAGAGCSGQVQVITDLLGLGDFVPRHASPYAHLRETILEAAARLRGGRRRRHVPGRRQRPSAWTTRSSTRSSGVGASDRGRPTIPAGGIPLDRDL